MWPVLTTRTKVLQKTTYSVTELSDLEGRIQLWQIKNFPNNDNLNPKQRLDMAPSELIHIHASLSIAPILTHTAKRFVTCIRDTNVPGSPTRNFIYEFNEIFYFHGKVLNTIYSLTERLLQIGYESYGLSWRKSWATARCEDKWNEKPHHIRKTLVVSANGYKRLWREITICPSKSWRTGGEDVYAWLTEWGSTKEVWMELVISWRLSL